jgi:hypothetical protein
MFSAVSVDIRMLYYLLLGPGWPECNDKEALDEFMLLAHNSIRNFGAENCYKAVLERICPTK